MVFFSSGMLSDAFEDCDIRAEIEVGCVFREIGRYMTEIFCGPILSFSNSKSKSEVNAKWDEEGNV
jgi:hypothetical protein